MNRRQQKPAGSNRSGDSTLVPAVRRAVRAGVRGYTPLALLLLAATAAMWAGFLLRGRKVSLPSPTDRLQVAALSTGEGEASWIQTPGGHFIVIGTGPPGQGARLAALLKDAGAKRIDLLMLPYPYSEAIGGAPELIATIPVVRAVEPGGPVVNRQQAQVRDLLRSRSIPTDTVRAGSILKLDRATIQILAPSNPMLAVNDASANNSLVVRVKWGTTAFLWAGGVEKAGEEALLAREPDMTAGWLRVARFAMGGTSSPEFLRLVRPEIAVVSVGANSSGYPDPDTMQRIAATGARVFRTDSQTAPLIFYSDGSRITGPY